MSGGHTQPRFAGATAGQPAVSGFESRRGASGHDAGPTETTPPIPTPHRFVFGIPPASPARISPHVSPLRATIGRLRPRHLGNSSIRCGVQYAKPATWRSAGVAEQGASDPVLRVGDRATVRRGYLGSSILPGAIGPKVGAFRPTRAIRCDPPRRYSDPDCARPSRSRYTSPPLATVPSVSPSDTGLRLVGVSSTLTGSLVSPIEHRSHQPGTRQPSKPRVPACVRSRWGRVTSPSPQDMMKHDPDTVQDTDRTADDAPPTLNAYPAGKNHENLLLTGPENDTQWIMSSDHVELEEVL